VVNDDLAAKTLREKCVKGDALRMVSHLDDLQEIWDTLDTDLERPEKYMEEALRPIVEFRKYKAADSCAVREFYSLLRAAIKGAKGIGRLSLLINDQTIPDHGQDALHRLERMGNEEARVDEGGLGANVQEVCGTEVAGRLECSCCGAAAVGVGKGEIHHEQTGSRQGTPSLQGNQQDNRRRERSEPAAPPQGALTDMEDLKLEEVPRAAPNRVRWEPRSAPLY
jgi:hypothetical protein